MTESWEHESRREGNTMTHGETEIGQALRCPGLKAPLWKCHGGTTRGRDFVMNLSVAS